MSNAVAISQSWRDIGPAPEDGSQESTNKASSPAKAILGFARSSTRIL